MGYDFIERAETSLGAIAYHQGGEGEPLILHHGGESYRAQYATFTPLLADGIHWICYDQRDVADSFAVEEAYTTADLADDCIRLMDALGLESAHIGGISYGGAIALQVAVRHPDRVASLFAGAAPVNFANGTDYAKQALAKPEQRTELMVDGCLTAHGQADPELYALVFSHLSKTYARPGSHRDEAIRNHDLVGDLESITAPTLLVYGSDDPLIDQQTGRLIADKVAGARLEIFEGARHGLAFEFPEKLARLLADFIPAHPATRTTPTNAQPMGEAQ